MGECNICTNYPLCKEHPEICGGKRKKTFINYPKIACKYELNKKEMIKKRNAYKRKINSNNAQKIQKKNQI